jgi:hypothetical protein
MPSLNRQWETVGDSDISGFFGGVFVFVTHQWRTFNEHGNETSDRLKYENFLTS